MEFDLIQGNLSYDLFYLCLLGLSLYLKFPCPISVSKRAVSASTRSLSASLAT